MGVDVPKRGRDFTDRVEFQVTHQMRVQLLALGFLMGSGKSYAQVARNLLHQAIETAVAHLSPERRKAYDEIKASVEVSETERTH